MQSTIDLVRTLLSAQFLVTAFLAVLLWSLHTRLRRQEYNRWWVIAWTLTALFLGLAHRALGFPAEWTPAKNVVFLATTLLGFLVVPALVFGAVTFRSPGAVSRRVAFGGLAAAVLVGAIAFAASRLASSGLTGFSVRHGTRMLALASALFFCAWVFLRHFRTTRSRAALVTGVSCLGYGITQGVYAAVQVAHVLGAATGAPPGHDRLAMLWSARLLFADVVLTCGICLGMVLLLVEEHQRSERALLESMSRGREVEEQNTALQMEIRSRQEAEEKLRASEDRYRDLVEHSEDLLCTHTLDGRLLSVNPAPARILGYTVEEVLAKRVTDFVAPDVRGDFLRYVQTLERDGVAEGLLKVVTRTGEYRLWQFRNTLRSDGVTTPIVRGMARDVTEQKRAERRARELQEELAHAGRVMTLGTLTGSLAHEIKQPLTAISTNTYAALGLLDRGGESPDVGAIRDALRDVMSDNGRIDDVIRRMRGMLRKERRERAPVDVNTIVGDVLRLVRSDFIGRRIALDVALGSQIPTVLADRVQLQQVVLNILMNAAEAVTAAGNGDERRVSLTTAVRGGTVSVSVADRGVGASAEHFNRLFEPFFTTKRDGMGLGTLHLPLDPRRPWRPDHGAPQPRSRPHLLVRARRMTQPHAATGGDGGMGGGATVFVIDDDLSVRNSLERLLRTVGYAVRTFASAEEFLNEEHRLGRGCLLVDVHLGRMTGIELQARIGGRETPWPVILASGDEDIELQVEASRLGAMAFFKKPFDLGALLGTIAQALAEPTTAAK